ncbi:MAG: thiamine pyrophosphate-dependent enzyme [Anaerolineae bacterium]
MSAAYAQTYLDETTLPYPFCSGCGHGPILNKLNEALLKLGLDPKKVVIVTDIGCVGLSDKYFVTNAFHGPHGRSVTYASGMKLANPELKVIVLMGDGGCGIGGHHLVNAARRNMGVTVLVFNNLNFGMTGGEHSVTTPYGSTTATTPRGNLERPLDICSTVAVNGASFVARATSFDKELTDWMAEAIATEGFSLLDIWELCTAYYVPNNKFSKTKLMATLQSLNLETGVLHREERKEYSRAYRQAHRDQVGLPILTRQGLEAKYTSKVKAKTHILLAGAAGQKIRSTATTFGRGALLCGLWATQRDDYPVTIMSGHSVSEIIISPEEIHYTGIPQPDMVVVLSQEGLNMVRSQISKLGPDDLLYINSSLLPVETEAKTFALDFGRLSRADFRKAGGRVTRKKIAVMAMASFLEHTGLYPLEAFKESIRIGLRPAIAQENLEAVAASEGLISEVM